jgi:thiol-disulfide isomerase/thioredoxin
MEMRSKLFFKTLFFLLCALVLVACSRTEAPKYYDNKGKPVGTNDVRGKWLVVNYWATWCGACRWEVPELNNFYQNNADKDVLLYGVDTASMDTNMQDEAINSMGIAYPVLRKDPGDDWHIPLVDLVPTTFIIDPDGKLVATISGATSEKSLKNILHKLKNEEK